MWRRARRERRPSWTAAPAAPRPPADPPAWAESHSGGLLHAAPRCRHSPQQTRPPSCWLSWGGEGWNTENRWLTDTLKAEQQDKSVLSLVLTYLSLSSKSSLDLARNICLQNRLVWLQLTTTADRQDSIHWLTASSTSRLTGCFGLSSVCSVLQTLTTSVTLHTNIQVGDVSNRSQYMILHRASANWGPLGFLIRPVHLILMSSKS